MLFNAAKRSNSPSDWEKYKCVRNKVVAMLRRNKRQYFYNLQFATQDFWKAIKVINKTSQFQMEILHLLQIMPKLNFLIPTFTNVLTTQFLFSVILSHLIQMAVLPPHFALKNKSQNLFVHWKINWA